MDHTIQQLKAGEVNLGVRLFSAALIFLQFTGP